MVIIVPVGGHVLRCIAPDDAVVHVMMQHSVRMRCQTMNHGYRSHGYRARIITWMDHGQGVQHRLP